jgi:hypothetical protein
MTPALNDQVKKREKIDFNEKADNTRQHSKIYTLAAAAPVTVGNQQAHMHPSTHSQTHTVLLLLLCCEGQTTTS